MPAQVTLLSCRGLALRGADPAAMKDFVLAVSTKVSALHSSGGSNSSNGGAKGAGGKAGGGTGSAGDGGGGTALSARARLLLELVIDVKNNRPTRAGGGGGKGKQGGGAAVSVSPAVAAWLRGCQVDRVAVRGISWDKLLLPGKKGERGRDAAPFCRVAGTTFLAWYP